VALTSNRCRTNPQRPAGRVEVLLAEMQLDADVLRAGVARKLERPPGEDQRP